MIPFGTLSDGQAVHAVDIAAGAISARILTRGATLRSVRLSGVERDLTVGDDDLSLYEGGGPLACHGAIVAPVGNRIRGARAVVDGRELRFPPNQGPHILHSGTVGTQFKVWEVEEERAEAVTLLVRLPDGEGGFPGNRVLRARFTAQAASTLRLELTGETDAPTLWNPVNHSYWNLDGTPTWEGHSLRIAADAYLPVDADVVPTGEIRPVSGTPFDFRAGSAPRPGEPVLDHNFCTGWDSGPVREVLWLSGRSGLSMALATTEPGVQVYDGNQGARPGAQRFEAFAIEAQRWPDAPHHAEFPSIVLRPGDAYRQVTEWRFARGAPP